MSNQSFIKFWWQIGTGYPIPVPGGGIREQKRGGMENGGGEESGGGGMESGGGESSRGEMEEEES